MGPNPALPRISFFLSFFFYKSWNLWGFWIQFFENSSHYYKTLNLLNLSCFKMSNQYRQLFQMLRWHGRPRPVRSDSQRDMFLAAIKQQRWHNYQRKLLQMELESHCIPQQYLFRRANYYNGKYLPIAYWSCTPSKYLLLQNLRGCVVVHNIVSWPLFVLLNIFVTFCQIYLRRHT